MATAHCTLDNSFRISNKLTLKKWLIKQISTIFGFPKKI